MANAKPKVENYTAAQAAELQTAYEGATDTASRKAVVEQFAAKFGKAPRSIIAKLSRMEVYVKPEAKSKLTGAKPVKKEQLAVDLTKLAGNYGVKLVSADKMAKVDQVALLAFFADMAKADADEADEDAANEVAAENAALLGDAETL